MKLSIVIPTDESTFNNKEHLQLQNVEIIFVGLQEAATRAERINRGVERSQGEMILLHHPRSHLPREAVEFLMNSKFEKAWGGFTHQFDFSHPLLQFTSFYSNQVRARLGIVYLDHCIFFHRSFWQPLPAISIFEDTVLSNRLKSFGPPKILPFKSTTSAVRFRKNGIWRQAIMNQLLKVGWYFNIPHARLNELYEKGLNLNAKK